MRATRENERLHSVVKLDFPLERASKSRKALGITSQRRLEAEEGAVRREPVQCVGFECHADEDGET